MRRPLSLLLCALLVGLAFNAFAQDAAGPHAVPVEPVKDFDVVTKGETLVHTFEIKNEGDTTLEIANVSPACGCTVAEFDKSIAPGQIGRVHAKVATSSFEGPIAKTIAVLTNDPGAPKLQLTVKAIVKPYIGIRPGYARYIYVQGEDADPIPQTLWAEDGKTFKISRVESPYDFVKVTFHEATEDERKPETVGSQWVIDVEIEPDAPVGTLRELVQVHLDHPEQKLLTIPISGFVRPRQHVTPEQVELGDLQVTNLPLERTLTFTSFINSPIEVKEIETGFAQLSAEFEDVGRVEGHRFKVRLKIGPNMPKGPIDTVLKIHTTDKRNPVFEVPFKATIL